MCRAWGSNSGPLACQADTLPIELPRSAGTRGELNEQLFLRQVVIQLPKYVTHIIGEPKYKYVQQEQVTVRYTTAVAPLNEI